MSSSRTQKEAQSLGYHLRSVARVVSPRASMYRNMKVFLYLYILAVFWTLPYLKSRPVQMLCIVLQQRNHLEFSQDGQAPLVPKSVKTMVREQANRNSNCRLAISTLRITWCANLRIMLSFFNVKYLAFVRVGSEGYG